MINADRGTIISGVLIHSPALVRTCSAPSVLARPSGNRPDFKMLGGLLPPRDPAPSAGGRRTSSKEGVAACRLLRWRRQRCICPQPDTQAQKQNHCFTTPECLLRVRGREVSYVYTPFPPHVRKTAYTLRSIWLPAAFAPPSLAQPPCFAPPSLTSPPPSLTMPTSAPVRARRRNCSSSVLLPCLPGRIRPSSGCYLNAAPSSSRR